MKLYLDTSVFGGYFDEEFKESTRKLFNEISQGKHEIFISFLTLEELDNAPKNIKELLTNIADKKLTHVSFSGEISELANKYLDNNVVTKKYIADALHIAAATISRSEIIISWNFKHMVNINRILRYNEINSKFGYKLIDIRTPKEVIYER